VDQVLGRSLVKLAWLDSFSQAGKDDAMDARKQRALDAINITQEKLNRAIVSDESDIRVRVTRAARDGAIDFHNREFPQHPTKMNPKTNKWQ
jgi:hypothetical protein